MTVTLSSADVIEGMREARWEKAREITNAVVKRERELGRTLTLLEHDGVVFEALALPDSKPDNQGGA